MNEVLSSDSNESKIDVGRTIVDAKCWAFVRNIHLYRYPAMYAQYWRHCRASSWVLGEVAGQWTDFLTDRMELDPKYSFKQKASWMTDNMNYIFKYLAKEDGLTKSQDLRQYVLEHASGSLESTVDYRDEKGQSIEVSSLMPDENAWKQMVTGKKRVRLDVDRFYSWLEPQIEHNWPELPNKPEHSISTPGHKDFNPFELMG
jgi:hypothetical protein